MAIREATSDAGLEIKRALTGRGVDLVIDFSGARAALQAALRGVAFGGTVVAGAYPPPHDGGLDLGAEAHHNIPNLVFSRACSDPGRDAPRWNYARVEDTCARMLAEGAIVGDAIVTPVVPFDELLDEYPKMATHPAEYIKLGVKFGEIE